MEKINHSLRVLTIFHRLKAGGHVEKHVLANEFSVSEKTIQRDFSEINQFFEKNTIVSQIVYDHAMKSYFLEEIEPNYLRAEEILLISKIILEARAIPQVEMGNLLDKLLVLASEENRVLINKIIKNEKHLYTNLQHSKTISDELWELARAIHKKQEVHIYYQKESDAIAKRHTLRPVGVIFSEFYFYLIAYKEGVGFPLVYRIDRMTAIEVLPKTFKIEESQRFEEGLFRKRVQFMYTGELLTIQFYFKGVSLQAVLDRLPTAKVIKKDDEKGILLSAEVYGTGIQMWLLSQGAAIEVISPLAFRQQMKETLKKMLSNYE